MYMSDAPRIVWETPPHTHGLAQANIDGVLWSVYTDWVNCSVVVYQHERLLMHDFSSVREAVDFIECNWRILNVAV
jgi:hypothetical protein